MPDIVSEIVEVCVFRFRDAHLEYLLLRRSPHDSLYPGIWQIVTGTIHPNERAVDAALRELKEETQLVPLRFWVVPHANVFYDRVADAMNLSPMFAVQVTDHDKPVLSEEHDAFEWVRLGPAKQRLVWPGQRDGLDVVEQSIGGGEAAMTLGLIPRGNP